MGNEIRIYEALKKSTGPLPHGNFFFTKTISFHKKGSHFRNFLIFSVGTVGFEPATPCL